MKSSHWTLSAAPLSFPKVYKYAYPNSQKEIACRRSSASGLRRWDLHIANVKRHTTPRIMSSRPPCHHMQALALLPSFLSRSGKKSTVAVQCRALCRIYDATARHRLSSQGAGKATTLWPFSICMIQAVTGPSVCFVLRAVP
jgi:hypothetical protein